MTNLRTGLWDALNASLTGYKLIGFPYEPDGITTPTVAFWATDLTHLPAAPNGHFSVEYTVKVFTGHQDPARADDALDESLTDVIEALWDLDSYVLESAQRTVSEDNTIHSWTLTVRGGIIISKEQ